MLLKFDGRIWDVHLTIGLVSVVCSLDLFVNKPLVDQMPSVTAATRATKNPAQL